MADLIVGFAAGFLGALAIILSRSRPQQQPTRYASELTEKNQHRANLIHAKAHNLLNRAGKNRRCDENYIVVTEEELLSIWNLSDLLRKDL